MDHCVEQCADSTLTCLEFTTYREQISEKFALEIEIKCAIDCGGAVIGHVLSPETPVFELLGDVITQTLRLRNEAPPGAVVVADAVKKHLNPDGFEFSPVTASVPNVFRVELKVVV
jgi:class 3 adenylate cyclase